MNQMNNDFIHIIEHMELILHWLNLMSIRLGFYMKRESSGKGECTIICLT